MTSLHSSTSSSEPTSAFEPRRYLRALGIALGALMTTLVAITAIGYHFGLVEVANHEIYGYQRDKVDTARTIDIAFVGDSSLGNAINAALFSSLTGHNTVNLALTGSYGSGGAYNMTYKVLQNHTPDLIVVMQSIDVMRRKDAFPGFYFSADASQLLTTSPIRILELYFSLKTARRVIDELWKNGFAKPEKLFVNDYIGQTSGHSPTAELGMNPLLPNMIVQAQLDYVGQIAELCRHHGAECVYAYGPIYDGYCVQAADYVAKVESGVAATGLPIVAGTPLCIPEAELGDTVDHVRPDLKDAYTRRYFELLRPYIDRLQATARAAQ
jgi:hypothetical protein